MVNIFDNIWTLKLSNGEKQKHENGNVQISQLKSNLSGNL